MIEGAYKKQVESAAEKKAKEVEKKDPTIADKPGRTLTDILNDTNESAIFGTFLDEGLSNRLAKNELGPKDLAVLEQKRILHIQKMHEVTALENEMTPEYIAGFAKYSPKFQEIVNLIGTKSSSEALKTQMRELMVSDSQKFNKLSEKLKDLIKYRSGKLGDVDAAIIEECRKNGVSEANFLEALSIENEDERNKVMQGYIRGSFGFFKKTADYITRGKWSKENAKNLAAKKTDMDEALSELNKRIEGVGGMLEKVVDGTDIVRNAFAAEIIGEKVPEQEPQTTFREARSEKVTEEKRIDIAWEEDKKATGFAGLDAAKQNAAREAFRQKMIEQDKESKKKKGFWATLFSSLFETTIKNKDLK